MEPKACSGVLDKWPLWQPGDFFAHEEKARKAHDSDGLDLEFHFKCARSDRPKRNVAG